jgi:hypothetical protein
MDSEFEIYVAYDSSTKRVPLFTAVTLFIYKLCRFRGAKIHLIHVILCNLPMKSVLCLFTDPFKVRGLQFFVELVNAL